MQIEILFLIIIVYVIIAMTSNLFLLTTEEFALGVNFICEIFSPFVLIFFIMKFIFMELFIPLVLMFIGSHPMYIMKKIFNKIEYYLKPIIKILDN